MPDERRIDEPVPTIVGPRPEGGPGGKVSVPQGIERLLTLAGVSTKWREQVLADPVRAAREAEIGLSASEQLILRATSRTALEQMADSLARRQGHPVLGRAAAGVAAAALLATGLSGCGEDVAVKGIRPDVPPPGSSQASGTSEAPAVLWARSLDQALTQAKSSNRAVMVVFPHPKPGTSVPAEYPATRGLSSDHPKPGIEQNGQKVVLTDSKEFRAAVRDAGLLATRVVMPPKPEGKLSENERIRYEKEMNAYLKIVYRHKLLATGATGPDQEVRSQNKLPAVVFLAPDGTVFSTLLQPQEETQLIEAIKAVPLQLATWITEQRKKEPPAPPPSAGTRPLPPAGE